MYPSPEQARILVVALLLALATACTDIVDVVPPDVTRSTCPPGQLQDVHVSGPENIYLADAGGLVTGRLVSGTAPAWSPDGGRIAFHHDGGIRVINADGSNAVTIASGLDPAWSPDGKRIAFRGAEGINTMDPDGSDVRNIVPHDYFSRPDRDFGMGQPVWSPDGAHIAFVHEGDPEAMVPAQVYVVSSSGGLPTRVSRFAGGRSFESDPSWSPDGSTIAYSSYERGIVFTNILAGESAALQTGCPIVAGRVRTAWTPDGSLALSQDKALSGGPATWIVLKDGKGARLFIADGYDAAWSPDGLRVAFVSRRPQ